MTLTEALDIVVSRTRHERFRWLCSDENPDEFSRERYRAIVMAQAAGTPQEMPSMAQMAVSALGAAGRVAGAVLAGQQVRVSPEVKAERLAICQACEFYEAIVELHEVRLHVAQARAGHRTLSARSAQMGPSDRGMRHDSRRAYRDGSARNSPSYAARPAAGA